MDSDFDTEFMKQLFELTKVAIWPGIFLLLVLKFKDGIATFFDDWTNIAFEAFGVKFSAQRAAEIGAELGAAEASKQLNVPGASDYKSVSFLTVPSSNIVGEETLLFPAGLEATPAEPLPVLDAAVDGTASLPQTLSEAVTGRRARSLARKSVLWVDDKPMNNQHEAEALRKLGISIRQVLDTAEGLSALRGKKYDLVITDLKRGKNPDAGFELIRQALSERPGQKIVVYTGYTSPKMREKAKALGALGVTSSPNQLFDLVVENLV